MLAVAGTSFDWLRMRTRGSLALKNQSMINKIPEEMNHGCEI
jgi:hypothetical protein